MAGPITLRARYTADLAESACEGVAMVADAPTDARIKSLPAAALSPKAYSGMLLRLT